MTQTVQPPPIQVPGIISALDGESRYRRLVCFLFACLIILAVAYVQSRYWIPSHGGVDQNGYIVGGKMLAQHGSMALQPRRADSNAIDPFGFVGRMWVGFDLGTPNERYLPKYPVGLPVIYAIVLHFAGPQLGSALLYLVSPIALAFALLAVHLMSRLLLGSIAALAVTLLVATSPVAVMLYNNPNSHAVTLFLVAWGMFCLFRFWLRGGVLAPIFAGLFIGSAVCIRYTEGMLILPVALVALFRWRSSRRMVPSLLLLAAWSIPVAALFIHNRIAMGAWTGYDPTNESTGFRWEYFLENWDTMLRQLYQTGFTLVFPLAVGGLAAGFVWNWRIALILASWILPSLLLYTAYYWAPETLSIGYTRFFLTIFPALGICAFGLLLWPAAHLESADEPTRRLLKRGAGVALALVTVLSVALGISNVAHMVEFERGQRENLLFRANQLATLLPEDAVLLSDEVSLLHFVQLTHNYTLYSPDVFQLSTITRLNDRRPAPDDPNPLDPSRTAYLTKLTQGKTQSQMDVLRDEILVGALQSHRRVFILTQGGSNRPLGIRFTDRRLETRLMASYTDPVAVSRESRGGLAGFARKRDRTPTTQSKAHFQIFELVLR